MFDCTFLFCGLCRQILKLHGRLLIKFALSSTFLSYNLLWLFIGVHERHLLLLIIFYKNLGLGRLVVEMIVGSSLAGLGLHLLSGFHDVVVFALDEMLLYLKLIIGLLILTNVTLKPVICLSQSLHLLGQVFNLLIVLQLKIVHLFYVTVFDVFSFF